MLRNYITTALRNLVRNRLYAAINIVGLAVGFAATILIALFIRDELSYDRWIPGQNRTYILVTAGATPMDGPRFVGADSDFAAQLKLEFPAIEQAARMAYAGERETLRHGKREDGARVFWADPGIFSILPLPVVAGDLSTALDTPDGIVISRKLAHKYFGRDDPIGETIDLDRRHPMRVTAVIADLPSDTHLLLDAIASARAAFSVIAEWDAKTQQDMNTNTRALTYLRLAPLATASTVQRALPEFLRRHKPPAAARNQSLELMPISEIHLSGVVGFGIPPGGDVKTLYGFGFVGLLIVFGAVINFINLMTARAGRRAVEIGVRKVSGAERRDLVVQFIGESFLYVAFALIAAIVLAHTLLPTLNSFLGGAIVSPAQAILAPARTIASPFAQGPAFLMSLLAISTLTAVLAGLYPALVLSAFRPAVVLRGSGGATAGFGRLRQTLVVLQFAMLIGIMVAAVITYRQTRFAVREHLRLDTDQVLIVGGNDPAHPIAACAPSFRDAVAALPGVRAVQCSSASALNIAGIALLVKRPDGSILPLSGIATDYDFFDFYSVKPLAGRVFMRDHGDAEASQTPDSTAVPGILNETAVRKFGFDTPQDAVGQRIAVDVNYFTGTKATQIEVIGVVPDIVTDIRYPQNAAAYYLTPKRFDLLNARLSGHDIPETLDAIDRLWARYGDPIPTPRTFLSAHIEQLHRSITQQAQLFATFSAVAAFVAILGMFGLATFIAERRTKEIGIRKSMGATRGDILRLLVWEFCKPVLWANLIAWPVAGYLMQRWLDGFAYHIDLEPWMFLAASALALVIAMLTVVGHALLVARAKPVTALRYE